MVDYYVREEISGARAMGLLGPETEEWIDIPSLSEIQKEITYFSLYIFSISSYNMDRPIKIHFLEQLFLNKNPVIWKIDVKTLLYPAPLSHLLSKWNKLKLFPTAGAP